MRLRSANPGTFYRKVPRGIGGTLNMMALLVVPPRPGASADPGRDGGRRERVERLEAKGRKTSIFTRTLGRGDEGQDVKALQVRVAAWFPSGAQVSFKVDGRYGAQTTRAVKEFRKGNGLKRSGRANKKVFAALARLEDPDRSTAHFDWEEFQQNSSASCSDKANRFAGSFRGGPISKRKVRQNVRRMMWRLEAIRTKVGNKTIAINSGFRSIAYNECIGGAGSSQHLFGAAADVKITEVDNRIAREVGKTSQIQGIGCYAELTHNHFDLRMENKALPGSQMWWWPERDKKGRDLDDAGKRCWGQGGTKVDQTNLLESQVVIAGLVISGNGIGSSAPSESEAEAWEAAGETGDYQGRD